MHQDEARGIFLQALPKLTEPLKSAVEFALTNRHNLKHRESVNLCDLPHEKWRDVVNYEGLYQVSNYGRVKSFHNNGVRLLKTQYVHILVAQSFIPNPEKKSYVNHIDGDKLNNHFENLEWATPAENSRHAWQNGLIESRTGTLNLHSKLTPEQVRYIRKNYKA